jgi:hypothetical protein
VPAGTPRLAISIAAREVIANLYGAGAGRPARAPFDRAVVDEATAAALAALARGTRPRRLEGACLADLRAAGEALYRALIPAPLRDELLRLDGTPLLIDPDPGLVGVPWELLHDGHRFFCRRFDLGRAPPTGQVRSRRVASPRMLIVTADPRGDLDVAEEGQAIVAELDASPGIGVRLVSGRDVDYVRRALSEYDLIHFAGHADYDRDDPGASGWHLHDGKLTARAVAELQGEKRPFLVFANACQSARAETWHADAPGSVFGLAGAFLSAGVAHYLGTQWEVVDAPSRRFARAFYSELARGRSVGAALRRARETVVAEEGEGDLAWAGYVLHGDPADSVLRPAPETELSAEQLALRQSIRAKRGSPLGGPPRSLTRPTPAVPRIPLRLLLLLALLLAAGVVLTVLALRT